MGKKKVRRRSKTKPVGRSGSSRLAIVIAIMGLVIVFARLGNGEGELNSASVARGEGLYQTYCASCHGEKGIGENPDDIYAMDEFGLVAPPMDDTGHAWHHTDEALIETILDGSPRNPRMVAWKDVLSREDAGDLVEYIKSLWSPRIRECQGPRHMECL